MKHGGREAQAALGEAGGVAYDEPLPEEYRHLFYYELNNWTGRGPAVGMFTVGILKAEEQCSFFRGQKPYQASSKALSR